MIEDITNYTLLSYYEQWIKILHYDPVGTPEKPPFSIEDLEREIYHRMSYYPYM